MEGGLVGQKRGKKAKKAGTEDKKRPKLSKTARRRNIRDSVVNPLARTIVPAAHVRRMLEAEMNAFGKRCSSSTPKMTISIQLAKQISRKISAQIVSEIERAQMVKQAARKGTKLEDAPANPGTADLYGVFAVSDPEFVNMLLKMSNRRG